MIRYTVTLMFLIATAGFGQCTISPEVRSGVGFTYNLFGPAGNGATGILLLGTCPGVGASSVRFQVDKTTGSIANGLLVVSPSSGVTSPQNAVEVGTTMNPNTVASTEPGTYNFLVTFTTVDQSPVSTTLPISITVTLFTPGPPVIQSVVNSASFAPVITPGATVSIVGTNLGPYATATFDAGGQYPTTLGHTAVTFNGIPAPLLNTSPGQINAIAPYGIAGESSVQVVITQYAQTTAEAVSNAFTVSETDNVVAIYTGAPNGNGPAGILNCDLQGCHPNSAANPAPAGSVITVLATVGNVWKNAVPDGSIAIPNGQLYPLDQLSLTIGGQATRILYDGIMPMQSWGLFQVNAVVPSGLASGTQPLILTVGQTSNTSQQTTIAVQ